MTTDDMIQVQVHIACGLARAWEAYTAPSAITQWNFAAPEWHCPWAENDLRVGGLMRSRMEARDGSMGFDFEGTYTEVMPMERLVYQLGPDRTVEATFRSIDEGQTALLVRFTPDPSHPREFQQGGWQSILNNYKTFAESTG